jgi:hypothetical protein
MKVTASHQGYIAKISLIAATAALLCFFVSSSTAYAEGTLSSKQATTQALQFAREIFHKAVIPAHSKKLKSRPTPLPANVPTEAVGDLKDIHAFYLVHMTKQALELFIRSHLDKQEKVTSTGSFFNSANGHAYNDITVTIKTNQVRAYLAQLIYTFAIGSNPYITYFRVDSDTVYLNPRSGQAIVPLNASVSIDLYTKPSLVHSAGGKVNVNVTPPNGRELVRVYDTEPMAPVTALCMENSLLYVLEFKWGHHSTTGKADVCGNTLYVVGSNHKEVSIYENCTLTINVSKILQKQHLTSEAKFISKFAQGC